MATKRMKEAFAIMEERNRLYLRKVNPEIAAEQDAEAAAAAAEAEPVIPEAPAEEAPSPVRLSRAERKQQRRERRAEERAERKYDREHKTLNGAELEKGDLPAIIISAFMVFGPILLILGALVAVAWIFLS